MKKAKRTTIEVQGTSIGILTQPSGDFIYLTDMLKAKDGDFFISDWLRNRNTVEFLGIWESVFNPDFNYGEFALIKGEAVLNSYKIRETRPHELFQLQSLFLAVSLSEDQHSEFVPSQLWLSLADCGVRNSCKPSTLSTHQCPVPIH